MKLPLIPQNRIPLCLFYFLVSNAGLFLAHHRFEEITPAFRDRRQVQTGISRLRPFLEGNGFYMVMEYGIGYYCMKRNS